MTIVANAAALMASVEAHLRTDLSEFAVYVEDLARSESESRWMDDSGSARASIVAYSLGDGDISHALNNPWWQAAQAAGYISPVWANPSENFLPVYDDVDLPGPGVVLTMLVPYAQDLEEGTSSGAIPEPQHKHSPRPPRLPNTLRDTTDIAAPDFQTAVEASLAKSLAD